MNRAGLLERASASLEEFYRDVNRIVKTLEDLHGGRLKCGKGCADCCMDDITVFEVEAHYIRKNCAQVIEMHPPHPAGACAFLDEKGSCRIYPFRPYVCRTQGLPLRWIDEDYGPSPVEMRDICPLSDAGPPVEELPADACWSIGPFEARLAGLQMGITPNDMKRVRLRDLFGGKGRGAEHTKNAGRQEDEE
jgi:hypothetical protein